MRSRTIVRAWNFRIKPNFAKTIYHFYMSIWTLAEIIAHSSSVTTLPQSWILDYDVRIKLWFIVFRSPDRFSIDEQGFASWRRNMSMND